MLHIIGDLISSVGVLIASIIIMVEDLTYVQLDPTSRTNRYLIADPICTFVFAVLVVFTTLPLMRECYHVLMESAPSHIDTEAMIEVIVDDVPGVVDVHELRVWSLSMGVTAVIVGVVVNVRGTGDKAVRASLDEATLPMVLSPSAHNDLVTTVQYLLWRRYRIRREHSWVTVQYR